MNGLFLNLVFLTDRYVHDVHTAEDIATDTFSELIVHKHRHNFKATLKTYPFAIGINRALDYLKHRKVIDFTELSTAYDISGDAKTLKKLFLRTSKKGASHHSGRECKLFYERIKRMQGRDIPPK